MSNRHVALPEDKGKRVDVVVARVAAASRSSVAQAVEDGLILRNGALTKPSAPLEIGDVIDYEVAAPKTIKPAAAQALPLDIVYEDEAIVVVNKAAGMVTHPAHGSPDGTLINALIAHVGQLPGDTLRPGLVHRLDRDTSGLLVVAKTEAALRTLGKAMMERSIEREYLGLVVGIPEHDRGTIEGAIGRDPHDRMKFAIRLDGKPAVTHYVLRERLIRASELIFKLETGRTHQIRVHLAAFGHPIICDPIYGRKDARLPLPGQALHARRLRLRHPFTGEELSFEVEPPQAYAIAREMLRRS
jgi:23S rRNA pseudouridine1911/1915/1917 synthase